MKCRAVIAWIAIYLNGRHVYWTDIDQPFVATLAKDSQLNI